VTGIGKMGDLKRVGRIGLKGIVYFEVMTTFALVLGLAVGLLVLCLRLPGAAGGQVRPLAISRFAAAKATSSSSIRSRKTFVTHSWTSGVR